MANNGLLSTLDTQVDMFRYQGQTLNSAQATEYLLMEAILLIQQLVLTKLGQFIIKMEQTRESE